MKATFIRLPLEFSVSLDGESWLQGELVRGRLTVKNRSLDRVILEKLQVSLAHGDFKKIDNKNPKGLTIIETKVLGEKIEIDSGAENIVKFDFRLSPDAAITDQSGSLYLLYNDSADITSSGHLQMMVDNKLVIQNFIQHFVQFFRFRVSQKKNKKGWVEFKLIPPSSREFANMDSCFCQLRLMDKELEIKYLFNTKSLDIVAGQAQMQKKQKEFEQKLAPDDYSIYGDNPNPEGIKKAIGEILKQVAPKLLF